MKLPSVDRRRILIGGGVAAGLVVAFYAWPRIDTGPLRAAKDDKSFNAYLRIARDGKVTLAVPQAETGQGIWTGLAQIAADELGAAWEQMAVEPAPISSHYDNTVLGATLDRPLQLTALGTSVRSFERPIRDASATARALLCRAAAEEWGVNPDECDTRGGFVIHENKQLGFGAVAEKAWRFDPGTPHLRAPGSGGVAGQELSRLDLPPKSDGSLRFAGDVRLPQMMFASVRLAPPGGRIVGLDRNAATRGNVAVRLVENDHWVAAVAETSWSADQALGRANPRFSANAIDNQVIAARLEAALRDGPFARLFDRGDYDSVTDGSRPLSATYGIAATPHHSLEPPAVAARWSGDRVELWVATQAPGLARSAAAKAAGIPDQQVVIYPMPIGDGGGRAVSAELVGIAVVVAKAVGRPVSVSMPPNIALSNDPVRPPMMVKLAALPSDGTVVSWHALIAGTAGLDAALASDGEEEPPPFKPRGGIPPYGIGAIRVAAADASPLRIRTGYMRGGDEAVLTFATESFMDELARAMGLDPMGIRMGLLGGAPRLAQVLTTAAAIGKWDGGARGSRMGMACASLQGSYIALVVEVAVSAAQNIEVQRMIAAVDCGRVINPGLVRQQIEGGLLAALANALLPVPDYVGSMIRAVPMRGQPFERLAQIPAIEIEIIDSKDAPGGISGLGTAVIAPAVANAIAAGTGKRLRNLPFDLFAS
nr:molybdopterin cofactor-binding domain-containing protein [uncultured Sphingomonas sp.]